MSRVVRTSLLRSLLFSAAMVSCSGCVVAGPLANIMVSSALNAAVSANSPGRYDEDVERETEQHRVARLIDHSRMRLYDPVSGPRCAVTAHRLTLGTWTLSSCDGALKCWALSEGYDCEKAPAEAGAQL